MKPGYALFPLLLLPLAAGAWTPAVTGGPPPARASSHPPDASPDSADTLVRRARGLERKEPGRAAGLYRRAADLVEGGTAAWLRLSGAQAAARAGDTAAVSRAAEGLADAPAIPADSIRLARVRGALAAGDEASGVALGRELSGAAAPRMWAEMLAPALVRSGDTAAALRGLLEAAAADPELDVYAPVRRLEPGWRALSRLARAERAADRPGRAEELLERALERAPVAERADLWRRLATVELRAGRPGAAHRSAGRGLAVVRDHELRARLEIGLARAHLARGERSQAEVHFRRGMEAGGGERSARAGYLLANLAHARGELASAGARYRRVAERFPDGRHGGLARMRLGLVAYHRGDAKAAIGHFRAYRRARTRGGWLTASLYWEGRALASSGRPEEAAERYRAVVGRDPLSWYGIRASTRLGREPLAAVPGWEERSDGRPPPGPEGTVGEPEASAGPRAVEAVAPRPAGPVPGARPDGVEALLGRMDRLRGWGWPERALAEMDAVDPDSVSGGRPLALAARLNGAGWTGPGIGLGWTVFERRGRWSPALVRTVWPLPYREALLRAAAERGLPPAVVAAVVRQESGFEARAVSRAGAVGLMQLMPATAAELLSDAPDQEVLMRPITSLELGTRYLQSLLLRFDGSLVGALVAYNAGPDRWLRWRRFPELEADAELLVERIPYAETRRYVKAVLRNSYLYARLYGLDDGDRPAAAPEG